MRVYRLVQGRSIGEVVCQARTAAVCANGSINHHYSTEPLIVSIDRKNDLYSLRRMAKKIRSKPDYDLIDRLRLLHILHYRGSKGGSRRQRPIEVMTGTMSYSNKHRINSNSNKSQLRLRHLIRPPIVADQAIGTGNQAKHQKIILESIYIINARSLAKSHAIEQLHADLIGHNIEVAIVTETFYKKHHLEGASFIENYKCYRRDRIGRS